MNRFLPLVAAALLALLLAGCMGRSSAPAPQPSPSAGVEQPSPPPSPDESASQPQPPPAPPVEPKAEPAHPAELISLAPAAEQPFERVRFKPGQVLGRVGLFVMQAATGEVDGFLWQPGQRPYAGISPDSRWVTVADQERVYLTDRQTEKLYHWPYAEMKLLAAQGDGLLFDQNGKLWLTGPDLKEWWALPPSGINAQARFAADSKVLFLLAEGRLYRVDLPAGTMQEIPIVSPAPATHTQRSMELRLAPGGDGVLLLPQGVELSPDGQLIAWEDGGVVVAGAADMKPLFRVRGADFCAERIFGPRWLADSSALIIRTRSGYQLVTREGQIVDSPALAGADTLQAPTADPDRADRFAIGASAVVDGDGRVIARAVPHEEGMWLGVAAPDPWGLGSDDLRFYLIDGGKGPRCSGGVELPPAVERPPFTTEQAYLVNLPAGDCLNLRAGHSISAPVITCLPGSTRLVRTGSPGRNNKGWIEEQGSDWMDYNGGGLWWHVKTEQGQRGWIAVSADYLTWAPARAGEPDPLTRALDDEVALFDYWLRVAAGEIPCTDCSQPSGFETFAIGLINRCAEPDPFLRFRQAGAYDPATHDGTLGHLTETCRIIKAAYANLGHPAETEAWLEQIRLARQRLSE